MSKVTPPETDASLDPENWAEFRVQAHRMLDDIIDYIVQIRERPVWKPMPKEVRDHFRAAIPCAPTPLEDVHREFMDYVLRYAGGNVHPGFLGWVQGGGTATGMLAEMLAGGLNANLGGRDHAPIEAERQILQWVSQLFGFPDTSSGLFVTGTSIANFWPCWWPAPRHWAIRYVATELVWRTCACAPMHPAPLMAVCLRQWIWPDWERGPFA